MAPIKNDSTQHIPEQPFHFPLLPPLSHHWDSRRPLHSKAGGASPSRSPCSLVKSLVSYVIPLFHKNFDTIFSGFTLPLTCCTFSPRYLPVVSNIFLKWNP